MNVRFATYVNEHLIVQRIVCIIGECRTITRAFFFAVSHSSSRSCGDGVCESCSPVYRPVPERDWLTPVRVCKWCDQAMNLAHMKA